jgi:MFS transporter, DHA3 family, macrolide efflux protein
VVVYKENSYRILGSQKQYLKLIAANVVNRFGDSLDAIAYSWLMYEVTGSASLMALILAINYIPTIVLQPIAGVFVDRISKKRAMIICDIGRGLIVLSTAVLFLQGMISPLALGVLTVANSTLEALRVPAGLAIVPSLLDKDKYTVGIALNSTLSRVCEVVGLASAGTIIALVGSHGALMIDAATFVLSAVIIGFIRIKAVVKDTIKSHKTVKEDFTAGLHYIWTTKMLLAIIILGMFMNFGMVPLNVLSTAYVVDSLKAGPQFLSFMHLALVAGMGLGAFITPKLERFSHRNMFVLSGFVVSAAVGALWYFPLMADTILRSVVMIGCLFLFGIGGGVQNVIFGAAFMSHVDKDYLGRVGGVTNAILCAAMPAGAFLCSIAAKFLPVPSVFLISAVFSFILYAIVSKVPILRDL